LCQVPSSTYSDFLSWRIWVGREEGPRALPKGAQRVER
jgi:hypothetical protein